MHNIFCSNNFNAYHLFSKDKIQIPDTLSKKVLLLAMGIFATVTLIYVIRNHFSNKFLNTPNLINQPNNNIKPIDPKIIDKVAPPINGNNLVNQKSGKEALANVYQQLDLAPQIFPVSQTLKNAKILYHKEIEKLQSFLSEQIKAPIDMDVTYICVGHGGVREQVWPGFIFEALQSGKKVNTYLFENGWKYSMDPDYEDVLVEYKNYLKADLEEEALQKFNTLTVKQFLCGFPNNKGNDDDFEESMQDMMKDLYVHDQMANIFWKNRQQVTNVLDTFNQYIEKILSEGKTVVLGDHTGWIQIDDDLVARYNQWVKKYPGQIHFVWGWDGCNLMTKTNIYFLWT